MQWSCLEADNRIDIQSEQIVIDGQIVSKHFLDLIHDIVRVGFSKSRQFVLMHSRGEVFYKS